MSSMIDRNSVDSRQQDLRLYDEIYTIRQNISKLTDKDVEGIGAITVGCCLPLDLATSILK